MRTNRHFGFREYFSAIRKLFLTRVSLAFLNLFGSDRLFVARDGGLGDAIMATTIVKLIQEKYSKTNVVVSSTFPQVFKNVETQRHRWSSFPIIWLNYGHYDFMPWKRNAEIHYMEMMANTAHVSNGFKKSLSLTISEEDLKADIVEFANNEDYLIIHSEAGEWFPEKNWQKDAWAKVIICLKERGFKVCQVGSNNSSKLEGVIDFVGKTTVEESLYLIKNAKLLIAVNSFSEQAAWAFNVPAVILYGPTNPKCSLNPNQVAVFNNRFVHYNQLGKLDYDFSEMRAIQPEKVLEAVEYILKAS